MSPEHKSKDEFDQSSHVEHRHSIISVDADLMNDAMEGENREHAEGLWAAVKSHP